MGNLILICIIQDYQLGIDLILICMFTEEYQLGIDKSRMGKHFDRWRVKGMFGYVDASTMGDLSDASANRTTQFIGL
ncbi:hypothetical protein Y032_0023g854 [Ancylostoma ceylanicum]|uniref:Uncharacterized protein n=1 Tax=Ancylostoma ceylanicum TaxID=53326 RepID=A0A016V045_9BILA|nr:hypothetical protein Y032_0023g854 [Ancylostoma ceylanicum]